MTNFPFTELSQFRDIESLNAYEELTGKGLVSHEKMMRYLRCKSRDHARTPMQWDDGPDAGFTDAVPWIAVNPNYKEINAKKELADKNSVFHYYRKLIKLRKEYEIIVYGSYQLILKEDTRVFAYLRSLGDERLLVVCNFSDEEVAVSLPEEFLSENVKCLIHNYNDPLHERPGRMLPYEAAAYYLQKE